MKRGLILLILTLYSSVISAYVDSDMDGVEDDVDKCPNTSFTSLVNLQGCSTEELLSPHHFDFIFGMSYLDSEPNTLLQTKTLISSVTIDYYYKEVSLGLSGAYYKEEGDEYEDNGLDDTIFSMAYQFKPMKLFFIEAGLSVVFPTYESSLGNNKTDYKASTNFNYTFERVSLYGGYEYSVINNEDIPLSVTYQNTHSASTGVGYKLSEKLYASFTYRVSNSIYLDVDDVKTVATYGYYKIDHNWFGTCSYVYGLSDSVSQNSISISMGYYL